MSSWNQVIFTFIDNLKNLVHPLRNNGYLHESLSTMWLNPNRYYHTKGKQNNEEKRNNSLSMEMTSPAECRKGKEYEKNGILQQSQIITFNS